jgi:hypothetical protein
MPLAGPMRRGAAMLLDLAAVGILTAVLRGIGGILFAVMFAWVFYRMARNREERGERGRFGRRVFQGLALLAILLALSKAWDTISGFGPTKGPAVRVVQPGSDTAFAGNLRSLGLRDVTGGLSDLVALRSATSPEEASAAGRRLAGRLIEVGASREDVRQALQNIMEDHADSATRAAVVTAALTRVDSVMRRRYASTDSLLLAWSRAEASGDTAAATARRSDLVDALTGGTVRRLRSRNKELQSELESARKPPGILSFIRTLANDLGIGVGWLGLYFTVFPVFWKGRTPGKRLLGIRTVLLTGEKIGWWNSFSRFGGYAAGLATGLLGFLQILWDPNRQGIQDRIAGTVVIRERGSAAGPSR